MRLTKHRADSIARMGTRIRETLKRCDPPLPDSLRLMTAQVIKDTMLKAYRGETEIHPGMVKFAKWGGCSERQARRNIRVLEAWGVMQPIAFAAGGKHATRYWVEPEALIRAMVVLGANPHPDLIDEIREQIDAAGLTSGRTWRADIRPDICPPEIRSISKPPSEPQAFRSALSQGGDDV